MEQLDEIGYLLGNRTDVNVNNPRLALFWIGWDQGWFLLFISSYKNTTPQTLAAPFYTQILDIHRHYCYFIYCVQLFCPHSLREIIYLNHNKSRMVVIMWLIVPSGLIKFVREWHLSSGNWFNIIHNSKFLNDHYNESYFNAMKVPIIYLFWNFQSIHAHYHDMVQNSCSCIWFPPQLINPIT